MERIKGPKMLDESATQAQLESFKKGWKNTLRIVGLLTLGAIGYITTEVITGNFNLNETSDAIISLAGVYSTTVTLHALRSLEYASSIEAKIASSNS